MKILTLLSLFLFAGSISAISDLNWKGDGKNQVSDIQVSIDNAERLTNGVFDLYRILSSNNDRLNQIVSNVHQTVGKDTYSVFHVFKHIKNGNYYIEIDTDKYNFAIQVVRMPISQHSHTPDAVPATTVAPPKPAPATTAAPGKPAPATTVEPPKPAPATTAAPGKPAPATTVEPGKPVPLTTSGPDTIPKTTASQQEIDKLRAKENKRFNQILGQWLYAGVKETSLSSNYGYMACDMITIFTHGTQFYFKVLEYKGNGTYEMHDTQIESVDKKNSLFKMGGDVYSYKFQQLDGNNYKVKILQLTNLNNSSDIRFFTEQIVNSNVLSKAFTDHFANLQITKINQVCTD